MEAWGYRHSSCCSARANSAPIWRVVEGMAGLSAVTSNVCAMASVYTLPAELIFTVAVKRWVFMSEGRLEKDCRIADVAGK